MDSRNAHENSRISATQPGPTALGAALDAVVEAAAHARERMPVERTGRPGPLSPDVRKAVLLRDGYTCQWCRAHVSQGYTFEVDHIVPWSAGGSNATDNLRTLCVECNQGRGNMRTDVATASALLIVGNCPWCRGRHYVSGRDTHDGVNAYIYDDAREIGPSDREQPVWCLGCRAPSATSRAHADDVRRRQADRWATPDEIARIRAETRTA